MREGLTSDMKTLMYDATQHWFHEGGVNIRYEDIDVRCYTTLVSRGRG